MAKKATKTVTVEQIGSPIRRPKEQRATLVGLGLNKMHQAPHAGGYAFGSRHDRRRAAPRPRRGREVAEREEKDDETQRSA